LIILVINIVLKESFQLQGVLPSESLISQYSTLNKQKAMAECTGHGFL